MIHPALPKTQGLYDPRNEHDACGVGFIANIDGTKTHSIVEQGLRILTNLTHRGATGADALMGDGSGILVQIPDGFLRTEGSKLGITLPQTGCYGVAMLFLPRNAESRSQCEQVITDFVFEEGQTVLGWRDVPVNNSGLGVGVRACEPMIRQLFVGRGAGCKDQDTFERKLFILHKRIQHAIRNLGLADGKMFYVASMSSRTVVYKGMLLASQVGDYYLDLRDPALTSGLALVHQRFSTNTFPSWELAHPFRMIAHNGEINTLRGNMNWMTARHAAIRSPILGDDLDKIWPLIPEDRKSVV